MKSIVVGLLLSLGISAVHAAETSGKLENKAVAWSWRVVDGKLQPVRLEDKLNGTTLSLSGECFQVVLGGGAVVKASDFKLDGPPQERLLYWRTTHSFRKHNKEVKILLNHK